MVVATSQRRQRSTIFHHLNVGKIHRERGCQTLLPQQLPGPNVDLWDWQMHGVCRGVDSSVFFHPDGERGRARAQREMRAKQMCRQCPVITQCRAHALQVGEPHGIWGGLSESERELMLKGRARRCSA